MKKFVILFSFFFLSLTAWAQITDDFEGNSLNWQEYSSSRREAVIKEGVLHMKSNSSKFVFATCTAPIDCSESFRIKAIIKDLRLTSDEKGVVIIFNHSDDYNNDQFRITRETIEYYKFAENKPIKYKDADFKLNKKLKEHVVVLQYRNRKAELYIDDVLCLDVSYVTMTYNGFGFAVFGDGQDVDIDKVEFQQM